MLHIKLENAVVTYQEYVDGFDTATQRSVEIVPAYNAPHSLFYFCYNHPNMAERIIIGDVDRLNGRYCKTPDYPNGTYAYFITETDSEQPAFPYIMGPEFKPILFSLVIHLLRVPLMSMMLVVLDSIRYKHLGIKSLMLMQETT